MIFTVVPRQDKITCGQFRIFKENDRYEIHSGNMLHKPVFPLVWGKRSRKVSECKNLTQSTNGYIYKMRRLKLIIPKKELLLLAGTTTCLNSNKEHIGSFFGLGNRRGAWR